MVTRKRLFFDIETSFNVGIFWKSGYKMNIGPENIIHERAIICVCWKWEGEDEIHYLHWDEEQSDKTLLEKFIKVINEADELIAHNGDRYDIKWLRTRCLYHGIPMFPKYETIDTLKSAKSLFLFNSNKLDYIAQFLNGEKKLDHEGLGLWKSVVLEKDADALQRMIDYCKQDVLILENVFKRLNEYINPKVNYAVLRGGEKFQCPECGSVTWVMNKTYTTSMGTIKHHVRCANRKCTKPFTFSNKTYMDYLKWRMMKG